MSLTGSALTQIVAQSAENEATLSPYVVGGVTLAIFLVALLALLAFGKGREHS